MRSGLPYTLVVILLMGGVAYFEDMLLSDSEVTTTVYIEPDGDNTFESLQTDDPDVSSHNKKVSILIQSILQDNQELSSIHKNPDVQLLSKEERVLLFARLAQEYFARHDYKNVINSSEKLDIKDRTVHQVQFIYAYSLSKTSSLRTAVIEYQLLIDHNPLSQAAHINLGLLLKKLGRCKDEALPVFAKAVSISSGNKKAKSLSGLAGCYYQTGQYDKAVEQYKKSIEYRPNSAKIWVLLAKSIAATGSTYKHALDAFDKGIALNVKDSKSLIHKAEYQIGHYDYIGGKPLVF